MDLSVGTTIVLYIKSEDTYCLPAVVYNCTNENYCNAVQSRVEYDVCALLFVAFAAWATAWIFTVLILRST